MIKGRDRIVILDAATKDNPNPQPRNARAHVSWNGGEQQMVSGDAPGYSVYLSRYLTVTYGSTVDIPQDSTVTFREHDYKPTGPEEQHTDMMGRLSHKTRRLLWVEQIA